jgi:hypothetical protein
VALLEIGRWSSKCRVFPTRSLYRSRPPGATVSRAAKAWLCMDFGAVFARAQLAFYPALPQKVCVNRR